LIHHLAIQAAPVIVPLGPRHVAFIPGHTEGWLPGSREPHPYPTSCGACLGCLAPCIGVGTALFFALAAEGSELHAPVPVVTNHTNTCVHRQRLESFAGLSRDCHTSKACSCLPRVIPLPSHYIPSRGWPSRKKTSADFRFLWLGTGSSTSWVSADFRANKTRFVM